MEVLGTRMKMSLFIVFLLFAVSVDVQAKGYMDIFEQHCQQSWNNISEFMNNKLDENNKDMLEPISRDLNLIQLQNPTQLMDDCVKFDIKKQTAIYQFARDTFLGCLPTEWHSFLSPVQNIMDYRKSLCEKPDVIAACSKIGITGELQTCVMKAKSSLNDFLTKDNPETSMEAFCIYFSERIDCAPAMYENCQSEAQSVIQEAYRKLRLPACGSSHVLVTNWLLLATLAMKTILHY